MPEAHEGATVIPGASGGIGSALARRLQRRGIPMILAGRDRELDPGNTWVTGRILAVDGGFSSLMPRCS